MIPAFLIKPHKCIQIVKVKPGTPLWQQCKDLQLCLEDQEEIEAATQDAWKEAYLQSLKGTSELYAVIVEEEVHMVFGLNRAPETFNVPWLLSDGFIQKHYGLHFLKQARDIIQTWLDEGQPLYNRVREERKSWLRVLGFSFGSKHTFRHPYKDKKIQLRVFYMYPNNIRR